MDWMHRIIGTGTSYIHTQTYRQTARIAVTVTLHGEGRLEYIFGFLLGLACCIDNMVLWDNILGLGFLHHRGSVSLFIMLTSPSGGFESGGL